MSLASKAIERVLCGVVGHLCGDVPTSTASRGGLAPSRRTFDVESYRRWQRCLSICRKALGSDVIFLALLLHSGSLWGIDYDGIEWRLQDLCAAPLAKVRAGTSISAANNNLSNHSGAPSPSVDDGPVLDADDSLHIYRQLMQEDSANMWALLVITFLNVVEFYERGVDEVSARQRRGHPPHPSMARTTSADGVASPVSGDGLCAPTASMESSGGSDEDEGSSSASSTMPPPRPGKTPKCGERRRRRPLGSHAPSSTHKANRNTHHGSSSPPKTGAGDASVGVSVEVLRELRLHGVASALMASPTMAGGRRSGGFEDASAESTHVVEDDVWMATVTITDEDEPLVQRVAALLADRFFHLFSIQCAGGEEVNVEDLVKMMEQNDDDDGSLQQQQQQQQKRVDPDIVRSWRDYLFSTAVKMAAYVDGTSSMLLEENVHLQAIIARHDLHARRIDEVFHASIPSIVSCFLAEEAAARSFVVSPAPWLCLPAPVYFLPFHVVGCGSRVAAWLPTELNKCRSSTTSSRVMMGELLSCQVTSLSWQVGTASFTSTTCTPPLPKYKIAAGLGIGLQWLDEQHTHGGRNELQRSVDALMPRMDAAQHTQHLHDAAPPSSSRRRLGTSATRGEPQSPWRWWCSSEAQLHAYLRVDAAAPRHLFMRAIPAKDKHDLTESSSRTHGAAAHRRRRAAENGLRLESLVCLYGQRHSPVGVRVAAMVERVCSGGSRGNTAGRATPASSCTTSAGGGEGYSRTSLKRDALAAIITYMHLASRRLIAMRRPAALGERRRGNAAHGESSADVMMAMMMGMGGGLTAGGKGAGEDVVGGVAPASPGSRTSSSAIPSLNQMSADQEVATVLEAAVVLSSMALLLTHSMADQIADVPAWMLWTVEVGSFVMDCSLATPRPLPRLLKAAGFVLVLLPNPPQALLLAVGLLATLGARQLQSIRGIAPSSWWNVFEAVVLRDDSIPGLLCPGTWELVRNVEASLSAGLAKVQARRSSASAAANHTSQRTLTSKTMLRLTAPTVGDAASSPSSSSSKPSSSTRRRLLLAMPTPSSDAAPTGGRRGRKPANTNIAAASATSSPHKSAAATFSAAPPAAAEVATTEELTQDVLDDGPLIGDDVVGGVPTLSVIKSFAACHDVVVAHGEENAITDGLAPINHHKRLRHDERADDAEMMLMADYSAAVVALWASLKGAYHNYVQQIHI